MALTDAQIKRHIDSGETQTLRDSRALFLRVGGSSTSWVCRHTRNGKTTKTTLGHYPAMTGNVARRERDRLTGGNADLGMTVAETVDDYRRLVSDKLKSGYQNEVYLCYLSAQFGTRKVATITRANLVQLVTRYGRERGARTADRLLSQLRGYCSLPHPGRFM